MSPDQERSRNERNSDLRAKLDVTIERIAEIYKHTNTFSEMAHILPEMKGLIGNMTTAQQLMAESAASMAKTFERQRADHAELTKIAIGKEQLPLESHRYVIKWTLIASITPAFLLAAIGLVYTLYITKTEIKASLNEVVVRQGETQRIIQRAKEEIKEEVSK